MTDITKDILRNPYFVCGVIIGCGITIFTFLVILLFFGITPGN